MEIIIKSGVENKIEDLAIQVILKRRVQQIFDKEKTSLFSEKVINSNFTYLFGNSDDFKLRFQAKTKYIDLKSIISDFLKIIDFINVDIDKIIFNKSYCTFWFYKEIELEDLISPFHEIFDFQDFYHDYENRWEWLTDNNPSKKYNVNFNLRREHHEGEGIYKNPIQIHLSLADDFTINWNKIIEELGNIFVQKFQTIIYQGQIEYRTNAEYDLEIEKIFEP